MLRYDFDSDKSEKNLRERGFDFDFSALVFEGATVECTDDRKDYGEARTIAFGQTDGLLYAVVYTVRDDLRWIISAFRCREREIRRWRRRAAGRLARPGPRRG